MKKNLPKPGRPVKVPSGHMPDYVTLKLGEIFRACGVPPDPQSIESVRYVMFSQIQFNSFAPVGHPDGVLPDNDLLVIELKIKFADLFLRDLDAMSKIVSRAARLADKVRNNPQIACIAFYCESKRRWDESSQAKPRTKLEAKIFAAERANIEKLETDDAESVATYLEPIVKGINSNAVRNAREQIRRLILLKSLRRKVIQ